MLSSNDEIIISTENHLANVTPWLTAAGSVGAKVKWWHIARLERNEKEHGKRKGPICESHDLRSLLSRKTRILAISHASNILGQIRDVKSICELAKECSDGFAHVVVDGVAAVPHLYPSVSTSGVDWYAISCHKLFGPHLGALCGRTAVVELLSKARGDTEPCKETLYKLMETGTINYEACAGIQGLGLYFRALASFSDQRSLSGLLQTRNQSTEPRQDRHEHLSPQHCSTCHELLVSDNNHELTEGDVVEAYNRIRCAESPLIDALRKGLASCGNVRIMENKDTTSLAKLPVFSFTHRLIPSSDIVEKCAAVGIVCRQSTFLSTAALQDAFGFGAGCLHSKDLLCGCEGVVRISLAHYNTIEEVNQLIETLESLPNW